MTNKRTKGKRKARLITGLFILSLIILIMVFFPPSMGKVPAYCDEYGNILPGSLNEKNYIDVDGSELGMRLLARDASKPVLLVCGGGPGIPEYLLESFYPSKLADEFIVCYLEYRGTGLSFDSKTDISKLTTDRYVDDIVEVTDYLTKRFDKQKIYILGHSFGSYVAIKSVQKYPDKYYAYIAMAQDTNQMESEYIAYDYMREQYRLKGDKKMLDRFDECPIRDSDEAYNTYFSSSLRDDAMHDLGVGTTRDMDSVIYDIFFPSLKCRAYTWSERINIWRGKIASNDFPVCNDSRVFNAFEEVPELQLPVYFFAGKYDYTCCYSLQKKYFDMVKAPQKEFYTFEESAHSPVYEEPDKAAELLNNIIEINN